MKPSIGTHLLMAALFGCALSAAPAFAQQAPVQDHGGHGMPASGNPVTDGFRQANEKMHMDMNVPLTGNAYRDFAQSMIPHHQGAIDMARIELNRVQFETRRFQFRSSPPLGDLGRLVLRVSNWTRFRARQGPRT